MNSYDLKSQYSVNFRKSIQSHNNSLAFATFGANYDKLSGNGPQMIRICRKIYHNVYALHQNGNQAQKHGQLYVLDNEMAKYCYKGYDCALKYAILM